MELQRGMRDKLDKYLDLNAKFTAAMNINGRAVYDYCCFGVDADGKLSDDRYMIFYNQTSSPAGEIVYAGTGSSAEYTVNLSALPKSINKLVFTASIDGAGTMGEISSHAFEIRQNGSAALSMRLSGSDFKNEKAVITAEIYMKDVWRINAVARGFDGGLGDLLRAYGGEELAPEPVQSAPAQNITAPPPASVRTAPAPAPVYNNPAPTYNNPAPAHSNPAPAYGNPAPAYSDPAPAYGNPAPAYGDPAPAYGDPAPAYGNPAPAYGNPAPAQTFQQYSTQSPSNSFAPSSGYISSFDPSSGYSNRGMPAGPVDTGYRSPNNTSFSSSSGQIDSYLR